jgi:hypothetical protein
MTSDTPEKRQTTRRPITHAVFMATGLGPPLKCQMLDVSELGARLRVGDPKAAPDMFLLILDRGLARWCQVAWRSDIEIGIQFVEPPETVKSMQKTDEMTEEEKNTEE